MTVCKKFARATKSAENLGGFWGLLRTPAVRRHDRPLPSHSVSIPGEEAQREESGQRLEGKEESSAEASCALSWVQGPGTLCQGPAMSHHLIVHEALCCRIIISPSLQDLIQKCGPGGPRGWPPCQHAESGGRTEQRLQSSQCKVCLVVFIPAVWDEGFSWSDPC